eukprot:4478617-Alexandrium_andersonii.AAC.1
MCTSRGVQGALRNTRKARQFCNPPQSAIRHAEHISIASSIRRSNCADPRTTATPAPEAAEGC